MSRESTAVSMSWLEPQMATVRAAHASGRLSHAVLIHESVGSGGAWLANWIAQLLLCVHPERAPCGACPSCQKVGRGQHPDVLRVAPSEESRQIRIEQVRELGQELALTSHQSGYKVAIVTPADALNRFAANALLKTLEEPTGRTVLILVTTLPSRLPPTVLSRCQRLHVRAPTREQAAAWLRQTRGEADWGAVLDILGDAPLVAAEMDAALVVQTGREVVQGITDSLAGRLDPVATAERWSKTELPLRLQCFENWLTKRIQEQFATPGLFTEVGAVPYLQGPETVLNIRGLFRLLDGVRDLKSALETPINRGLALESLLRRLVPGRQREPVSTAR